MSIPGPSTKPLNPHYCQICTLPTEYCEFGPSVSKCKNALSESNPNEYNRIWGEGSLSTRMGTLSVEKQEKLQKDAEKLERKGEKKAEAEMKRKEITIKRSERTKRKHQTHIHGLDLFDIDLKKAAKMMASKFATGASVSKNNQGEDEIVIQGDVGDEIVEMLRKEVKELKGAPVDQVVRVDEKRKKAEAEA